MTPPSRRLLLGGALALTACKGRAADDIAVTWRGTPKFIHSGPAPILKDAASFPVGCAIKAEALDDPAYADLLARQFSQVTADWQMKMEYIVRDDGGFRFDAPDAIAAFARAHGMRLFGHNLVWYAQQPPAFVRIQGSGAPFANAYRNYILAVAGRYRGQAAGWDVVNEPIAEDGEGGRDSLWARNLGAIDYIRLAFEHAREADPGAVLFINDYNLEILPKKRVAFMALVGRLLEMGVPVGGIGCQTHVNADLAPGAITTAVRELATLGLKVHISEMDVSINRSRGLMLDRAELARRQTRLYAEAADAFAGLPPSQRFAFTVWGLRDRDSWLRSASENPHPPADTPLLFDDDGQAKPAVWAMAEAFRRGR